MAGRRPNNEQHDEGKRDTHHAFASRHTHLGENQRQHNGENQSNAKGADENHAVLRQGHAVPHENIALETEPADDERTRRHGAAQRQGKGSLRPEKPVRQKVQKQQRAGNAQPHAREQGQRTRPGPTRRY